MDPACFVSTLKACGGGAIMWEMFYWKTLNPFIPINNGLNPTSCLSIVSDHVHPFMATNDPSSNGYCQHDNAQSKSCHKLVF